MPMAKPILVRRLRNDFALAESELGAVLPEVPDNPEFPFVFDVTIVASGYSSPGTGCNTHTFTVFISDEYPYERPKVKWRSEIFHPNIMPPSEGGTVCVMHLDHWDFNSDIYGFIKALTELVNNPNPYDPLRTPTCDSAAKWFLENL